jgi:hypothetical protein
MGLEFLTREDVPAGAQLFDLAKDLNASRAEWDNVLTFRFHARCRHRPKPGFKINLGPSRASDFARARRR